MKLLIFDESNYKNFINNTLNRNKDLYRFNYKKIKVKILNNLIFY